MKVLFIALGIYGRIGGIERFNQRVVRCLAELAGSQVRQGRVIALWDSPAQRVHAPQPLAFVSGSSRKLKTAASFAWHVLEMQPDVILYGHVLLAPLAYVARALAPRARNMLFVHGWEVWGDSSYRKIPPWEPFVLRTCFDRVISVSRFTASKMKTAYRLPLSRFAVFPNAVDVEASILPAAKAPETGPCEGEYRLLTVTRLSEGTQYKGCDKVIRALPRVMAAYPNTYYHVVGEGPLRRELELLAEQVGVRDHVRFLGRLSDEELAQEYRRSHLYVMPSTGEGFGIVFLEAWLHGLPVIAGNRDASAEVVTNGVDGLTVDPESIEDLARAIISLLTDRQAAAEMGAKGRAKVLTYYTHDHFRTRLAALLRE